MSKLTRMTRHMNYIFSQYVNKIINDIIKDVLVESHKKIHKLKNIILK